MKNKKQIVFYCASTPTVMIYKIGRILKKNGYFPILFAMCEKEQFDHRFYSEAFDKIILSNFQFSKLGLNYFFYIARRTPNLLKFLFLLKKTSPYLFIGTLGNNWQLRLIHKYFFRKVPFIYFPYDIISHSFSNKEDCLKEGVREFEIRAEKYCLENCDGIIHKGNPNELKILNGRIHKNLKLASLQLTFLPYCSKEFYPITPEEKLSKNKEDIHLVCPGFLPNDPELIKKLIQIFDKFAEQKIHIHIYAMVNHISRKKEHEYITHLTESLVKNPYIHFHNPLGAKEITKEITKYDFGFIVSYDRNPNNLEPKLCTGNKISTFLEAGIPIICEDSLEFMSNMIKDYGIGISFNEKNAGVLRENINKISPKIFLRNIEKAKTTFDMEKNFSKLENFMKRAVKKNKSKL